MRVDFASTFAAMKSSIMAVAGKISDSAIKTRLEALHSQAELVLQAYDTERRKIGTDTRLSVDGKFQAQKEAQTEALAKLAEIEKAAAEYRSQADAVLAAATGATTVDPLEALRLEMRLAEVRAKLGDSAETRYNFEQNHNKASIISDAVESSPLPFDFVTEATRTKTAQIKLSETRPADAKRFADFRLAAVCIDSMIDGAKQLMIRQ
jgi:hypothetical protein